MEKCLAFVLGGGGARGAMQVGALRALFEAGYQPDMLVGTSIGAVNAACLALWGVNQDGVTALEWTYQGGAEARLMDPRLGHLDLHALSVRPNYYASQRVKQFFISVGEHQVQPLSVVGNSRQIGQKGGNNGGHFSTKGVSSQAFPN